MVQRVRKRVVSQIETSSESGDNSSSVASRVTDRVSVSSGVTRGLEEIDYDWDSETATGGSDAEGDKQDDSDFVDDGADGDAEDGSASTEEAPPAPNPATTAESTDVDADGNKRILVRAMTIRTFRSWPEFFAHLHQYESDTMQVLAIRTSTSVRERNKRMTKQGCPASSLIPLHHDKYSVTVVCTHSGEHRSRCGGERGRQEVRSMGCTFKMTATLQVSSPAAIDASGNVQPAQYQINVSEKSLVHNHRVDKRVFAQYAHRRMQLTPESVAIVDSLRRAGTRRTGMLKYIRENTTSNPTLRDVHNLCAALKAEEQGNTTLEERIEQWVESFSTDGNVGRVFVNQSKVATCITLQTQHMRKMFATFPEVLLVDATHGTNSSNYKLFSFMIHDTNGHGQHVHHALIENERQETMETVIDQFKSVNSDWEKIECIVIDKDFTEMEALRTGFPNARILLCQFHVVKYLYEECAKAVYGFSSWEKERVKSAVDKLVYARTHREYDVAYRYLEAVLSVRTGTNQVRGGTNSVGAATDSSEKDFLAYFDKNWGNCREMWCSFERQNVTTLGNNTNNRLESSWRRIKEIVNQFMELDETIFALIYYQNSRETAFEDSLTRLGTVVVHGYDKEMSQLANMVSEHACKLVETQYNYARATSRYRFYRIQENMYLLSSQEDESDDAVDEPGSEYAIDTDTWSCSCFFTATHRLPCRHILYVRKMWKSEKKVKTLIPFSEIHSRWVLGRVLQQSLPPPVNVPFTVEQIRTRTLHALPPNVKYRLAADASKAIGQALSELGTQEFGSALILYENIASLFKQKRHREMSNVLKIAFHSVEGTSWSSVPNPREEVQAQGATPASPTPDNSLDTPASVEQPTRSVHPPTELVNAPTPTNNNKSSEARSTQESILADVAALNTQDLVDAVAEHENDDLAMTPDWIIAPNVRAPGRPKNNRPTERKKKRVRRENASQESRVVESELSLQTLKYTLSMDATYDTSAFVICQFGIQAMASKLKSPVAHLLTAKNKKKLSSSSSILSIMPLDILTISSKKISQKQERERNSTGVSLAENKIVVELPKVGWYTTEQIRTMRLWHHARDVVSLVDEATEWLAAGSEQGPHISAAIVRLKQVRILSDERSVLDFCGKRELSDSAIEMAMKGAFDAFPGILFVTASSHGFSYDIALLTEDIIAMILADIDSRDMLLLPILINGNHWCGIVVDKIMSTVTVYDPFGSHHEILKNFSKHKLAPRFGEGTRLRIYNPVAQQSDVVNCGVFVLLFFEEMTLGIRPDRLEEKDLQEHRRRYMRQWLICRFKQAV